MPLIASYENHSFRVSFTCENTLFTVKTEHRSICTATCDEKWFEILVVQSINKDEIRAIFKKEVDKYSRTRWEKIRSYFCLQK